MIKLYLKQAWTLIKQNKLFTSIYVVGTGLSIALTAQFENLGELVKNTIFVA